VRLRDLALAVPLKRYDGKTIGAVNVTNQAGDSQIDRHLASLRAASVDLQRQLF
jgi:hypothetical protein